VQRELERLTAAGLLTATRIGNQKHYQANCDSPIFEELEAIVLKIMPTLARETGTARGARTVQETRAPYVAGGGGPTPRVPKRKLDAFCRRHRIKRLGIFGSAARGELGNASDVDLLVEFEKDAHASLFDMVRMQDELSRMLGRKVDLATTAILENPYRRRSILKDLRELYAG